jgi:hypothetical protein
VIDDQRAAQWAKDASTALMCNLHRNNEIARLASIILSLLADRKEREHYIGREGR